MKLKLPEEPHYLLLCLDEQLQHIFSSNLLHSWLQEDLRAEFFNLSLLGRYLVTQLVICLGITGHMFFSACIYLWKERVRSVSPLRFLPWNICFMWSWGMMPAKLIEYPARWPEEFFLSPLCPQAQLGRAGTLSRGLHGFCRGACLCSRYKVIIKPIPRLHFFFF